MSVAIGPDVVAAKSVRDLVRPQLGLDEDPWELALVQRDLVWKQDRMVSLLDMPDEIRGIEIGSLDEGDEVEFEIEQSPKGPQAVDVTRV